MTEPLPYRDVGYGDNAGAVICNREQEDLLGFRVGLAGRTMTVVATVVDRNLGPAVVATVNVPAQGRGTARSDGVQCFVLLRAEGVPLPVTVAVAAHDVADC